MLTKQQLDQISAAYEAAYQKALDVRREAEQRAWDVCEATHAQLGADYLAATDPANPDNL